MKKTLAIAALALGLFAFGCDDDEDPPKGDAGRPDASDASTTPDATAEAGKVDTIVGTPDGGDAGEAGAPVDAGSSDGGSDALSAITWTNCVDPKDNVPPAAFCLQYLSACTFDATGGAAGMERYKSLVDCTMAYEALTATKKGCVAYHLCVASGGGAATALHCPHPPQASLATPAGPCAAK
jgi:hypothetical protein